jgi:hypothetical protein
MRVVTVSDQPTGVQFNAKQIIWFILTTLIFPLTIEVDGVASRGVWDQQLLNLAPGTHTIAASWKLYWVLPVNKATLNVEVAPGGVVAVTYKIRWFFLLPGKLFLEQAA